jgi:hypothetical protein
MTYTLYIHDEFKARRQSADIVHRNEYIEWVLLQLAIEGRTPRVKGTRHDLPWRRTPIKGCHYYLWWIPAGVKGMQDFSNDIEEKAIFVRDIRGHDETKLPLNFGTIEDYAFDETRISEIDPRTEEQKDLDSIKFDNNISIKIVKGIPGSGKTLAIHYVTRQIVENGNQVLYVTYTEGLKEDALRFFRAHNIEQQVKVATLGEIQSLILGKKANHTNNGCQDNKNAFLSLLSHKRPQLRQHIKKWKGYDRALWNEVRGYLLGMALPLEWERKGIGLITNSGNILGELDYQRIRNQAGFNDLNCIRQAFQLLSRHMHEEEIEEIFVEQYEARKAIEKIHEYLPDEIRNLTAIVVDEIQDFTLLQIFLLTQIGAQNTIKNKSFKFVLAGDESQTLYPSGFDWGITQDLFYQLFLVQPDQKFLNEQKRSPAKLFDLITSTKNLYTAYLPSDLRPQGLGSQEHLSDDYQDGLFFKWILNKNDDLNSILEELDQPNYHNLAIIDLNDYTKQEEPSVFLGTQLSENAIRILERVRYSVDSIKGLEREIIIIFGMGKIIEKMCSDSHIVASLENRNLIDEIRVALTRSTNILIICETDLKVMHSQTILNLDNAKEVNWSQLSENLISAYEDMTAIEIIYGYIQNAKELIAKGDYARANLENKKALDYYSLHSLDDIDIKQKINGQEVLIKEELLKGLINQAKYEFLQDKIDLAINSCAKIRNFESKILQSLDSSLIELSKSIKKALDCYEKYKNLLIDYDSILTLDDDKEKIIEFAQKYISISERVEEILESIKVDTIKSKVQNKIQLDKKKTKYFTRIQNQERQEIHKNVVELATNGFWRMAVNYEVNINPSDRSQYFAYCSQLRKELGQSYEKIQLLSDRYSSLPSIKQISDVKELIYKYLIPFVEDTNTGHKAINIIVTEWICEIIDLMGSNINQEIYLEIYKYLKQSIIQNESLKFIKNNKEIENRFIELASQQLSLEDFIEINQFFETQDLQKLLSLKQSIDKHEHSISSSAHEISKYISEYQLSDAMKDKIKQKIYAVVSDRFS